MQSTQSCAVDSRSIRHKKRGAVSNCSSIGPGVRRTCYARLWALVECRWADARCFFQTQFSGTYNVLGVPPVRLGLLRDNFSMSGTRILALNPTGRDCRNRNALMGFAWRKVNKILSLFHKKAYEKFGTY